MGATVLRTTRFSRRANAGLGGAAGRPQIREAPSPPQRLAPPDARSEVEAREQRHRIRNLLSNVQAIASISARSAESVERFVHGLNERIAALSGAQELLAGGAAAVELRRLLHSQLDHAGLAASVKLGGPRVEVPASIATPLALAIHELKANAIEFGSLSSPGGMVLVRWRLEASGGRLRIEWLERGGPPADGPSRTGFGTQFLERLLGERFRVERRFGSNGLSATIEVALQED